ncbi:MAG: hypothetical protein LBR28_02830 [Bacteroidales bacterium]|nr:hypothetical protein [Bacteroidales bacterium]
MNKHNINTLLKAQKRALDARSLPDRLFVGVVGATASFSGSYIAYIVKLFIRFNYSLPASHQFIFNLLKIFTRMCKSFICIRRGFTVIPHTSAVMWKTAVCIRKSAFYIHNLKIVKYEN